MEYAKYNVFFQTINTLQLYVCYIHKKNGISLFYDKISYLTNNGLLGRCYVVYIIVNYMLHNLLSANFNECVMT